MEPAKNQQSVAAASSTTGDGEKRAPSVRRSSGRGVSSGFKPELLEFQSDITEIELSPVDSRVRWTLYTVVAFIVTSIIWASVTEVDQFVITNGSLAPVSPQLVVQPLTTGRIREIHVRVGRIVQAGEKLVTLDSTFTKADVNRFQGQLQRVQAVKARLEAELNNTPFSSPEGEMSEAWRDQLALYTARQAQYSAQFQSHEQQIAQLTASLETNRQDQRSYVGRISGLTELLANARSRGERLESHNVLRMAQAECDSLVLKEKELEAKLRQAESERAAFVQQWTSTIADNIATVNSDHDALLEELTKANELNKSVVLRSPETPSRAVVLELAKLSVGSVVREAEPLVTLVPLDEDLEVDLEIQSKDIGRIRTGQTVRVKLEAFPFLKHGTLSGQVTNITEGSFQKDQFGYSTVYRARIALTSSVNELRKMPPAFELLPGMKVIGEVRVGKRRVIRYFLNPILRFLDESVREP